MAETIVSPGVLTRENDQSQITSAPVVVGAALLGPTVKGKPNIPTIVTSYSDYQSKFGYNFTSGSSGGAVEKSFFTSIAAQNYFANGGETLAVTRIVTQSALYSPATSSAIPTGSGLPVGTTSSSPFVLETLSEGAILNSANDDGTSTVGTNHILTNGTEDNFRWEIANSNTTNGTFTLIIRRGDDKFTQKSVLETFANLSLDPKSPNYITKQVGDQVQTLRGAGTTDVYLQTTGSYRNASRYVRVKEVNFNTPDYFDNNGTAKTAFTASIPVNSSGTFGGATGNIYYGADTLYEKVNSTTTQGLGGPAYTDAINLHANKDDFRFNVISAPGLYYEGYPTQVNRLIEVCEDRGDAIAVVDLVAYGSTLTNVTTQGTNIDSSYAATYWPWVQIQEPDLGTLEYVFPSTLIPGVYAFTDNVSEPWFAPAGINRGGLSRVNQAERKLTQLNRDDLYTQKINPLATFPGRGVVVFGQKTLQNASTALDRVNVRRLLIALKTFIGQVADNLVFEQNTAATRNNFLAQVNPYLESVQQRQGLFAFNVVMDDSNNTPDVIDRNQLIGQIFVQPTRTAEFIILDFNILPTGAEFPS